MPPAILVLLSLACRTDPSGGSVRQSPDSDAGTTPGADTEVTVGLVPATDPGMPEFPDTIGRLSVTVGTGSDAWDGTDDNTLSVCLTDSTCVPLNLEDVDDFRLGGVDTYQFEGLALPRSSVDRVEVRSKDGADAWTLSCLQLAFDGEPVYCRDHIDVRFGNEEEDEVEVWTDTLGMSCATCEPSHLTEGPIVGHGTEAARVWVRTDATRQVGLQLARDASDLANAPVYAWAYPTPDHDFTAVLEADGATADTTYHYAVTVDGAVEATGTLHTAPVAGTHRATRVAFGSCSKDDSQPIFEHIRSLEPDLMLFIGDNHYGNTDDLGSLRWYYRWAHSRAGRAELMANTVTLATWDDHDYVGNNTHGFEPGRDTALGAFSEYWVNPAYGRTDLEGVFFQTSWGDVDLFFVDDRYWRSWDDSLLGAAQTSWLVDAMKASTAAFKVVVCGSQWTSNGSSDSWAAFPEARTALIETLQGAEVMGIVLLSGDIHRSEFRSLAAVGGGYRIPEITSSPLATWNSYCGSASSEVVTCFDDGPSFVLLDFDTTLEDPLLAASLYDRNGTVQHRWEILRSTLQ